MWIAGSTPRHYDGREVRELELPAELAEASLRDVRAVGPGVSLWTASFNDPQRVQVLRYDGEWTVLHERTTELYSIQLGPITAVGDEIFQSFVPGRDSSHLDVMADMAGLVVAMLLYMAFTRD